MDERRRWPRRLVTLPLSIIPYHTGDTSLERVGVTRNVSASGALFHSHVNLSIGDRVELAFRSFDGSSQDMQVHGTVVRVSRDKPGLHTIFPHVAAVSFDNLVATLSETSLAG